MSFFTKKAAEPHLRHLLTVNDDRGVETFVLEASVYSIGRDPSNAIVIHSDAASRQHAILLRVPNPDKTYSYAIQDGNLEGKTSANGVIVNGIRIKKHILKSGDEIVLGGKVILIYRTALLSDKELEEKVTHPEYRKLKGNVLISEQTIQGYFDTTTNLNTPKVPAYIKAEIDSFRQCYEFVLQELKDLGLSHSDYVTIAASIYQKMPKNSSN